MNLPNKITLSRICAHMSHPRVRGGVFPGYDPVQLLYRRGHIYRGGVYRFCRRSHRSRARAGHQPGQISRPHRGQSPRRGGVHLPARAAGNAHRAVAGGLGARVCGRVRRRHSGARTHRQRVPHGRGVRGARSIAMLLFGADFFGIALASRILNGIGIVSLGVATALTIWSGVSYIVRNRAVFKES